jgi:urea transport system substrate-binding protein
MKNTMWCWLVAGSTLLAATSASWVGGATAADASTALSGTATVGLVTDVTGADSIFGPPTLDVAELAVSQINAAGGVDGHTVKLAVQDDQSTPQGALQAAQQLVQSKHVSVLLSMDSSAAREAILPVASAAKVLYLYTPVFEGDACNADMFTNGEVPNQQLKEAIPYVEQATGKKKWYLLGDDYVYPEKSFEVARQYIKAAGGSVVGDTLVPLGTTDFQAVIQKIKASGANIMLPYLVGGDAIAFEKQAYAAGIGNSKIQRLAGLYPAQSLQAMGASVAAGMDVSMGYFQQVATKSNAAFIKAYTQKFGSNAPAVNSLSENTYVAIRAWADAANKAKSTAASSVTKALQGLELSAPAGNVTFQDNRYMTQPIYIAQAEANGSIKILKDLGEITADQSCNP